MMIVAAYLIAVAYIGYDTLADLRGDLAFTNSMLVQAVRATLNSHELVLRGLGGELVAQGALTRPERGRRLIERMRRIDPGMVGFGLAGPDGQLVLVSGVAGNLALPNLSDQPESAGSFLEVLNTPRMRVGRPYFFKDLGTWVVPIRVAIRDSAGRVQAVMTAGYSLDHATTAWNHVTLLPHVTAVLVGAHDNYLRYLYPPPGNQPDLPTLYAAPASKAATDQVRSNRIGNGIWGVFMPRFGAHNYVVHERIPEFDLYAASVVPRSAFIAKWMQRLVMPSLLMIMFVGGGWIAYRHARRQHSYAEAALNRSRQELVESNDNLRLVHTLSEHLHQTLTLDGILQEALQALRNLAQAPHIAIYLMHPDGMRLRLAASHGFSSEAAAMGNELPLEGSLSGIALAQDILVYAMDIATETRIFPAVRNALLAMGAKSATCVPLFFQGKAIGAINLVYDGMHPLSDGEESTLVSLGNSIALAITNARHMDRLSYQARHDSLTSLPNRLMLQEALQEAIVRASHKQEQVVLMLLDLDRFKEINDTLGHDAGDELLKRVSQRLHQLCSPCEALLARLGGDEFAILCSERLFSRGIVNMANTLIESLRKPFDIHGMMLSVGASIGVAYAPVHGTDSHKLLRAADVAMYQAKKHSLGVMVYDNHFDTYSAERLELAHDLRNAIEHNEFILHYQPKIDTRTNAIAGFEALVRWQHPRLGLLYPDTFMHLAEINELIYPFTRMVMHMVVAEKRILRELGYAQPIAFNFSALNVNDDRLLADLRQALSTHRVSPREIEIELTETALMRDTERACSLLKRYNRLGIHILIDDFGTGYSSLSYLRQLPIKALKIDRTFVKAMDIQKKDNSIVRSTILLAHALGLDVVAEGVETEEVFSLLREIGCNHAQGYWISRPLPIEELGAWLTERETA